MEKPISRDDDGNLVYTHEGLRALLTELVARTGGLKQDGQVIVAAAEDNKGPEHVWIPDADAVVQARGKLVDPYLSGLVQSEEVTFVVPNQYTILAENKTDPVAIEQLADGLARYGGLRRPHDPKNGMSEDVFRDYEADKGVNLDAYGWAADGRDRPRVRDLSVFNAPRTALHWVSILTAMYVKTDVPMPNGNDADSIDFAKWVEARDANYVQQVNQIYYQLFGIDRTLKQELKNSDVTVLGGAEERLNAIQHLWKTQRDAVNRHIGEAVSAHLEGQSQSEGYFTKEEHDRIALAIKNTKERRDASGNLLNAQADNHALKAIIEPWLANDLFNARMNDAMSKEMERYFAEQIFTTKHYQRKNYVPQEERETYALTGGSATGKSLPMALLAEKLAKGIAPRDAPEWKRQGLDLNDAVHIKSEVMRTLLLEPELLKKGNRLFMDESAHDERSLIRNKLFQYMEKVLSQTADPDLLEKGTGPVVIHDRRSMSSAHRKVLTGDGAHLNAYYFNVPPKEALRRNRFRGTLDLQTLSDPEKQREIDLETYAPRFVNARNNIMSQRMAAERALALIDQGTGKDVTLGYFSTDVKYGERPDLSCLVECDDRVMKVHDIPRLLSMVDSTNFGFDAAIQEKAGPLPGVLGDYATLPERYQGLDHESAKAIAGKTRRVERQKANAEKLADLFSGYAKEGYQVQISSAPKEEREDIKSNEIYAVLSPPVRRGDAPRLTIMQPEMYQKKREPHNKGSQRHDDFFSALENRVEKRNMHHRHHREMARVGDREAHADLHEAISRTWQDKVRPQSAQGPKERVHDR